MADFPRSSSRTMNSLRQVAAAVCAILLAACCASVSAQDPQKPKPAPAPPPPTQQPATGASGGQVVIRVPVNEVVIPVTVKDHGGRLVPDLNKGDFRVFEDNVE